MLPPDVWNPSCPQISNVHGNSLLRRASDCFEILLLIPFTIASPRMSFVVRPSSYHPTSSPPVKNKILKAKIPRCQTKATKKGGPWSSKATAGYVYVDKNDVVGQPIATKVKTICDNTWVTGRDVFRFRGRCLCFAGSTGPDR